MSSMLHRQRHLFALLLFLLMAAPPLRAWLESSMTGHMLIQIPLLVAIGVVWGLAVPPRLERKLAAVNAYGIPTVLLALFGSTFWMLPRSLDVALESPAMEAAKFLSLPLWVGLPLALSWKRLPIIGRGFVWANLVSMLGVVGWLYIAAPVRVCTNYLANQQITAGWSMVALAGALMLVWAGPAFVGRPRHLAAHSPAAAHP